MNRSGVAAGVKVAGPRAAAAWVMLGLGALLAVVVILAGDSDVTGSAVVAVSLGAMAAVAYGIRRHRPENPRVWWLCLGGVILGMVAGALTAVPATADRVVLIDLIYVVGFTLFVAAGVTALPRRQGHADWASQLDAITIATAGGLAFWYFWASPVLRAELSVHTVAVGLIWPLYDLMLLSVSYRLATSGEPWRFPMTMIVTALTGSAAADLVYATQGEARTGSSLDALLLVPMTALGAAALHPQMRTFAADPDRTPLRITSASVFWISVATFGVPIVVGAHAWRTGRLQEESTALLAVVVVLVVLGAARSAEMVRQVGRARDQLSVVNTELRSALGELQRAMVETQGLQEELAHSATHDALTGLANRRLLRERLDALFADRRRTEAVLLFLDLDDFKDLNDTLGHQAGDQALVALGHRINEALRPGDLVARLGGDEFAVLLVNADLDTVNMIADRLLEVISQPCAIGPAAVSLHVSIGAAWAAFAATSDDLIRQADLAMYQAKTTGKNRFEFFDPAQHGPDTVSRSLHQLGATSPAG